MNLIHTLYPSGVYRTYITKKITIQQRALPQCYFHDGLRGFIYFYKEENLKWMSLSRKFFVSKFDLFSACIEDPHIIGFQDWLQGRIRTRWWTAERWWLTERRLHQLLLLASCIFHSAARNKKVCGLPIFLLSFLFWKTKTLFSNDFSFIILWCKRGQYLNF